MITVSGTESTSIQSLNESSQIEDPCQECGKESDYGAHGIRNGEVYDEYHCEECYNKVDSKEKVENENSICGRPTPEDQPIRVIQEVPIMVEPDYCINEARFGS